MLLYKYTSFIFNYFYIGFLDGYYEYLYMNWYKIYKIALRGEYWIIDGVSVFADGDTGDISHEGYVIQSIQSQYAYDQFNHGEYVDWDGFRKELALEAFKEQFGQRPTEQYYKKSMGQMNELSLNKLKELGMTNDEIEIADGRGDARRYGMEYLGWKRVAGNNIQTQNITSEDLKTIANGLYDAYQDEIEDSTLFNIEVNATGAFYRDVPYYLISDGAPSQMLQYTTNMAYSNSNSWYKTAKRELDSDVIGSISYNTLNKNLTLKFKRGGSYVYTDVPQEVFKNFTQSKSKGDFFNRQIRDKYQYSKA